MNKTNLVKAISQRTRLTEADVQTVLNLFCDEIVDCLSRSEPISVSGFGSFIAARKKARVAFRPGTREKINVPEKLVARFRPAKRLKEMNALTTS